MLPTSKGFRLRLLLVPLATIAGLVLVVLALRLPFFGTAVANFVLARASTLPGATLVVREAYGDWLTHLELRGVRMLRNGVVLASADTARARYSLWPLLRGEVRIASLEATGATVDPRLLDALKERPSAPARKLSLTDLLRGRFYEGPELHVGRIAVHGVREDDVRLEVRDFALGNGFAFELDSLKLRLRPPGREAKGIDLSMRASLRGGRLELPELRLKSAASDVRARGGLAPGAADSVPAAWLKLDAAPVLLSDLDPFLGRPKRGAEPLEGALTVTASLEGSALDRLSGNLVASLESARVGGLLLGPSRLDAVMREGRADIVLNATVEEAPVATRGWLRPLDTRPTYDLHVAATRLPARIPGAPWWPDFARRAPLAAELRIRGRGYSNAVLAIEGGARGEVGAVDLRGRLDLSRGIAWDLDGLAIEEFDVARAAGDTTASRFNAVLHARGEGGSWAQHRAWARLDLGRSSYGAWDLTSGSVLANMDGQRGGASMGLELDGGSLAVDTLVWRMDGSSPFRLRGARLRVLDLAKFTGNTALPGEIKVALDLEGSGLAGLNSPDGAAGALRAGLIKARGHAHLDPSRFRERTLRRGDLQIALAGGELTLEGEVESDAGQLSAELQARPFDAAPVYRLRRGRFDRLDLSAWGGAKGLQMDLAGALTGEAHLAPASAGARSTTESWSAGLRLDRSRIGSLAISGGELQATGTERLARVAGTLAARAGVVTLDAELSATDSLPRARGRLDVPLGVLMGLAGRDSLRSDGTLSLTVDAVGPFHDLRELIASGRVSGRGSIEQARLDSLLLAFHVDRGVVTLDSLALRSNLAAVRAAGSVALADSIRGARLVSGTAALHAEIDLLDAAPLAPLLGADSLSLGSGFLVLDLSGFARERSLTLRSDLSLLTWDRLRLTGAKGEIHGTLDRGWHVVKGRAVAEIGRLNVAGASVSSARLRAESDGALLRFDGDGAFGKRDSLRLAGSLAADSSGWIVALERLDMVADSTRWRLSRAARMDVGEGRLDLEDFEAVSTTGGRIAARGALDRRGTQTFRLELQNAGLGFLSPWLDLGDLHGSVDGLFEVGGHAAAPRASGRLRALLNSRGSPAGIVGARLTWDGAGLDLSGAFSSPEGDSLVLSGHLPLGFSLAPSDSAGPRRPPAAEQLTELHIAADRFPLQALAPILAQADVGALGGTLSMDMRVRGSGTTFSGAGRVEVSGGLIELPTLGTRYDDVQLRGAWNGDHLAIEELRARTAKGRLEALGSVRIASLTKIEPDLTIRADRAVLANTRELRLVTTGEVHLGGTLAAPIVKGRVRFSGCQYKIPSEAFAGAPTSGEVQLSPAERRMLEETFTYVATTAPDPVAAFYEDSDLDLALVLERNNWVNQTAAPRFSAEVTGEVQLRKKPHGELLLVGRLEPVARRGFVEQFGRTFVLAGGEVLLNGGMQSHTMLIQSEYGNRGSGSSTEESDVVVHLDLEGKFDELRLILSSEPALSETEIVTFIATGRSPTTRVETSQNSQSEAAALGRDIGLSQITGAIEGEAKQSVGLDVLKVRYDALRGATMVAGRYVAPQVYIGFQQPLQVTATGTENNGEQFQTLVEMEYEAYRWLFLNVQGETSLIRSFLRFKREY